MTGDKMTILDANGDPKYEIDGKNNIIDLREIYCICEAPVVQSIKIDGEVICDRCSKIIPIKRESC
jgi:hypothetical protein